MSSAIKSKDAALIALFSIFAIVPLFRPEFFASHDMLAPVYRLLELDTCVNTPVVRWLPDLYGGRGAPLFNFYPPFSYYVAEVFHILGLGYINSIKACYILSFVLSGVFMYRFACERVGRYPAVLAGVLYMYAPYHLYDVYVRGDLAESFAFVFFPLVLYSIDRGRVKLGAISYALLILTHNVSALLFTGFMVFYAALFRKEISLRAVLSMTVSGLVLSAFYWIPALFEKHLVNIENVLIFAPEKNFLGVYELLGSIGFVPLLIALAAVPLSRDKNTRIFGGIFFVLAFLMTKYSSFIWTFPFLSLASYVQFPWRLLAIEALVVSILGAYAASAVGLKRGAMALSILVVISSFGFIGYSEHIPVLEENITREELVTLNAGLSYGHEYLPKGAEILNSPAGSDVERTEDGTITVKERSCTSLAFEYDGSATTSRVNTYYFPGWTAYVDGERRDVQTDENGLILLELPEGRHEVSLKFEDTPVRKFSELLSLLAFMALALQTAIAYRGASRFRSG